MFTGQVVEQHGRINDLTGFIDAKKDVTTMYVWGTIMYRDMFKLPRETDFCFVFYPHETRTTVRSLRRT